MTDTRDVLLAAIAAVSSELDLQAVLLRIAEAAAQLVDARYAALGVIGEDGMLAQFVTVGLEDEDVEAIGPLPRGHGLLGELIRHPVPLRLEDLRSHVASHGFPAGHPPMASFLGVPVRVRDQVFGNLYLTDKRSGPFDEEDERLVLSLAATVGIAVENARLYDASQRRERAAAAAAEMTTSLLSGADPELVLERAAERAGSLVDADLGLIALEHDGRLLVEVSWGPDVSVPTGTLTSTGPLGRVLDTGTAQVFAPGELAHVWPGRPVGEAIAVPLGPGVCVAARSVGRVAFTDEQVTELRSFAEQVTVALELAQRRRDAEQQSVHADRDRIARDLHDLVIQRLFATGMQLESVVQLIADPAARDRVRSSVDDLDHTIREIRSTIYALSHTPYDARPSLRHQLLEVVDASEERLGFAPTVRLSGLLDTTVPAAVAEHVLAVVQEALSNVARHAQASAVVLEVDAREDLTVRVVDDGVGVPEGGRRSGLQNLADRAVLAGGALTVTARPQGGTALEWRVPLG